MGTYAFKKVGNGFTLRINSGRAKGYSGIRSYIADGHLLSIETNDGPIPTIDVRTETITRDGVAKTGDAETVGADLATNLFFLAKGGGGGLVGDLYNKSSWNGLNDYTMAGGTYTISGGKIQTPSVASQAATLALDMPTSLDNFTINYRMKALTVPSAGDFGLMLKLAPMSASGFAPQIFFYLSQHNATNTYKLVIADYNGFTGSDRLSPTAFASILANDIIDFQITFLDGVVTFSATKGGVTITATGTKGYTTADVLATNISKWTWLSGTWTWEIQSFQWNCPYSRSGLFAVGDSLTWGKAAGSAAARWPTLLGAQIIAGCGETTADVLARLPELIAVTQVGSKILIMISTNDININSPAVAVVQNNMVDIDRGLIQAGRIPLFVGPPPLNGKNTLQMNTFIDAEFAGRNITTIYPALNNAGSIAAIYDGGDGVHINAAGQPVIAGLISASGKL